MDQRLERLKAQYNQITIPEELGFVVRKALQRQYRRDKQHLFMNVVAASAALILLIGINTSPAFAKALEEVPIVGSLVKVLTFREYKIDEGTMKGTIKVPEIQALGNKSLEDALNKQYLEEGKQLYTEFVAEMEQLKLAGGGHLGLDSGYIVKTDSDRILAVGRYVVNTVGSSSTTFKYDTIDKQNQLLITLPSLFKDDRYISLISDNIKEQMQAQMQADPQKFYWVEGAGNKIPALNFMSIVKDQMFYIDKDGKLVIVFNKYEVAPGYMGVVEFVIPTPVLNDVLVSNEYIH